MPHETKEAVAHEDVRRTFEVFKEANDLRPDALEKRRPDPLLDEKVDRIERALGAIEAAAQRVELVARRPALALDGQPPMQRKSAWSAYLRRGDESQLGDLELKALSVGTPSDGGHIAPPDIDAMITRRLVDSSPMRQTASVRTTGASTFRRVVSTTVAGTGWASETAARPQGATPSLAVVDAPIAEQFALLAATQTLLDDAFVNVDEWLAAECESAFAAQERSAFVSGDGAGKPRGFLAYPIAADTASNAWGTIGYLATGVAGAFAASAPTDRLLDLVFAPRAQYRQNGRFVMNRRTLAAVRKLKDSANNYI
jgi:HK97 family phage major capsid protein